MMSMGGAMNFQFLIWKVMQECAFSPGVGLILHQNYTGAKMKQLYGIMMVIVLLYWMVMEMKL